MIERRRFLTRSLCAGVSFLALDRAGHCDEKIGSNKQSKGRQDSTPNYALSRDVPTRLFDGERCWCHPRAGVVPGAGAAGVPSVVMTMNTMHLSGSDVFKGMYGLRTDDLGKMWTEPRQYATLAPRYETIDGQKRPVAVSDFWPGWHAATNTLLGTGHTVVYTPDWKVRNPRPRHTSFSIYNPQKDTWASWQKMEMPDAEKFHDFGAGCTQRYDADDGTILLPFYFRPPGMNSNVAVARCTFDGKKLRYEDHGSELHIDDKTRGLHEPSLARFGGEYFLTIRNDKQGFITRSKDGLHFDPIQPWRFDDDSGLGNYNTQQHWVTHSDGLFLVYNRRGANNDHVFRHRAPLFMAQVDPKRLRVIRKTERILVPERGARLGNFGITNVNQDETWVTVAEWMQPKGVEKHGSDGSLFVARVHWAKPNKNA